jgi:CheY-like chemotaxis protein
MAEVKTDVVDLEPDGEERFAALKVMVAEDNAINRQVVGYLLQRLNIEALMAHDGKEAVELSEKFPIDLILMDLQMPEMDGLEATRNILNRPDQKPPQIIAMTANALPEDRKRCYEAGMVDFLPKPMLLDDLKKVLNEALQRQV